jgi:hypothetical protein
MVLGSLERFEVLFVRSLSLNWGAANGATGETRSAGVGLPELSLCIDGNSSATASHDDRRGYMLGAVLGRRRA